MAFSTRRPVCDRTLGPRPVTHFQPWHVATVLTPGQQGVEQGDGRNTHRHRTPDSRRLESHTRHPAPASDSTAARTSICRFVRTPHQLGAVRHDAAARQAAAWPCDALARQTVVAQPRRQRMPPRSRQVPSPAASAKTTMRSAWFQATQHSVCSGSKLEDFDYAETDTERAELRSNAEVQRASTESIFPKAGISVPHSALCGGVTVTSRIRKCAMPWPIPTIEMPVRR